MDLISREDLLKQIDEDSKGHQGAYGDMWEFLDTIAKMPTIESRPKGKWVKESDYKVMGEGYMWNCSECGNRVYVDSGGVFPNYCGDCGAEMENE